MLGRQNPRMDLADAVLWTGKIELKPLVEMGSFHDRFAAVRPTILRDEDFGHWFDEGMGRRSIPPSVVAGAFLLALREGCSDRETEQRMRFDLRWKWALGLGLNDHGCDHSRLFREIVGRAVEAGLLTKRAVQVMDSSPMLGAAAVQDTYKQNEPEPGFAGTGRPGRVLPRPGGQHRVPNRQPGDGGLM